MPVSVTVWATPGFRVFAAEVEVYAASAWPEAEDFRGSGKEIMPDSRHFVEAQQSHDVLPPFANLQILH